MNYLLYSQLGDCVQIKYEAEKAHYGDGDYILLLINDLSLICVAPSV